MATGGKVVCVFCGSSPGADPRFAEAARQTGRLIAERGFRLLFGGGDIGLMGETARAARAAGAHVIGVLPDFLRHLEPPRGSSQTLLGVADLFQRKARMIALSDAFVVLPGGPGTMDEFFEILTAAQLRQHAKPIVLVNLAGFFDPLEGLMDHFIRSGFAGESIRALYRAVAAPEEAVAFIAERLAAA
ncbi:MAG TPA: TIGR00730 family Rossman fold protein [Rhizomicrobium sp.]|nr:TIGR00730 family Rossman fold protein [Rhizomicrobium sp.]